MTRAELRARINTVRARHAVLEQEADELLNLSKYSGDETENGKAERKLYTAQYDIWAKERDEAAAEIRKLERELEALTEHLRTYVLQAARGVELALDALLDAECRCNVAGEMELSRQIDSCRKALVRVGLGSLHDLI